MKTDRELLELAAKAVGIAIEYRVAGTENIGGSVKKFRVTAWHGPYLTGTDTDWNPLHDDGDALRLAVKLKLSVLVGQNLTRIEDLESYYHVYHKDDPYAATRHAIVRAAAAIGEMK